MTDRATELRVQALGAAISRRDWHAVEQAHAAIRDASPPPDREAPMADRAHEIARETVASAYNFGRLSETLLTEAIAAAIMAARPQWRPIEEAPTDGTTPVLLAWPFWSRLPVIGWYMPGGKWDADEALNDDGPPPIAWMPLPTLPTPPGETT